MKKLFLFLMVLFSLSANSQSVIGAWERDHVSENGDKLKSVVIFADGYQSISIFKSESGEFVYSNGGTWSLNGDIMTEKVEFDTGNPERVGSEVSFKVIVDERTLTVPENNRKWDRIDDGNPGELQGAWLMGGRVRDGNKQMRETSGPRKTMKILSGKRFQWIAYNTESKRFMGTGGGTYSTIDGIYTENIEFFSRDNSKAGLSLEFNFTIENNEWNHSGYSSKGDPMHEIWIRRE
ncbi:MAG TPA: membrane or secreted protein [Flavobacteriaceae bacterium]|nr:membrane or secreted protein [Flavobacteriaceae bacterium]|tara:strand:+ start:1439 stop:2146 length:708 start_codon:yes stop_codon:yes gene_type:complete